MSRPTAAPVSVGASSGQPDWNALAGHVHALRDAAALVRASMLRTVDGPDPGPLVAEVSALADALNSHLPTLKNAAAQGSAMPPGFGLQLQQLGADLLHLAQINTRLSVQTQQALAVLLPAADAVRGYASLAGRSAPFVGGAAAVASLKA